jgi:hypothetical protein
MKPGTQWIVTGVVAAAVLGYLMWRSASASASPPSWLPKLPAQPNPMQGDLGPVHATFPLSGINLKTYRTQTFTSPVGLMASPSENVLVLATIAPRTGGVFYDTQGNRYFATSPLV